MNTHYSENSRQINRTRKQSRFNPPRFGSSAENRASPPEFQGLISLSGNRSGRRVRYSGDGAGGVVHPSISSRANRRYLPSPRLSSHRAGPHGRKLGRRAIMEMERMIFYRKLIPCTALIILVFFYLKLLSSPTGTRHA